MSDAPAPPPADAGKPAILQDEKFVVHEGFAYRAARTGAIWMNKLFFSSLVLLGVWLIVGSLNHDVGCATVPRAGNVTGGLVTSCNVFLSPTAGFLGAMAIASFLLSIGFGMLGLVFGKKIVEASQADDEVGARKP
jgi:hypothetical protein